MLVKDEFVYERKQPNHVLKENSLNIQAVIEIDTIFLSLQKDLTLIPRRWGLLSVLHIIYLHIFLSILCFKIILGYFLA